MDQFTQISPQDMQVGDVVCLLNCLNHPWMNSIVVRIEHLTVGTDSLIYLQRPHMRLDEDTHGPWLAVEHYSTYASSKGAWVLLSRS